MMGVIRIDNEPQGDQLTITMFKKFNLNTFFSCVCLLFTKHKVFSSSFYLFIETNILIIFQEI